MKPWARWTVGVGSALVVVGIVVVGSQGSGITPATVANVPPATLSASTTTADQTTVVFAMGKFDEPANTFYELFTHKDGDTAWKLATPPGVADNGGLVVGSGAAGSLTAGFLPSADLTFSVLAHSVDGGAHWTPGDIPGTLAAVPDALATGVDGRVAAVLARPDQAVIESDPVTKMWQRVVLPNQLDRATSRCGVSAITAVAVTSANVPVVGAGCAHSSAVGLFVSKGPPPSGAVAPPTGAKWSLVGPVFGGRTPSATSVVRLEAGLTGITGLAKGDVDGAVELMGLWGDTGATGGIGFTGSPALVLPSGWSLLSSGIGGGGGRGVTVLVGSGASRRVETTDGPGQPWVRLATAPTGTTAVATVGNVTDAFVPSGTSLTVWSTTSGATSWTRVGRQSVPLPYGSSG